MQANSNSKSPGQGWWMYGKTVHMSVKSDLSTLHWSTKQRTFLSSWPAPWSHLIAVKEPSALLPAHCPDLINQLKIHMLFSQVCSLLSSSFHRTGFTNPLQSFPWRFTIFLSSPSQWATALVPSLWIHFILCNVIYRFFSLRWEMRAVWIRGCAGTTF